MTPFLLGCLLLIPVSAQNFSGSNRSGNGLTSIQYSGFTSGPNEHKVLNVTATFRRNSTAFGWVAIAWITQAVKTAGTMTDGLDVFWCAKDNTVLRAYFTGVAGIASVQDECGVRQVEGECSTLNNGSIMSKTIRFRRDVFCYEKPPIRCLNHTFGNVPMSFANGPYDANDIISTHVRLEAGFFDLALGPTPPTQPTQPRTDAPSKAPSIKSPPTQAPPTPAQVVSGYPQGFTTTGGANVGWEYLGATSEVRFALETSNSFAWIGLGLQDLGVTTKMTGEAFIVNDTSSATGPLSYRVTYSGTPSLNPGPGPYFTNGSFTSTGGKYRMEFTRTLAATSGANSVAISNPSAMRLMVGLGSSPFPNVHGFRVEQTANLLTGTSTSSVRVPSAKAKIAGIVIIGACCVLGLLFTLGFSHTCLGRCLFFRRLCKDNRFMGPHTPSCFDLTWGQAVLVLIYFGMIALFSRLEFGDETELRFARAMGWTSTAALACASIPVARQSILLYFFGMSFERAVLMHRIAARFAILIVLIHFLAIISEPGYMPFKLLPVNEPIGDYMIVQQYGFWAFILMLVSFVTSLPLIRRRWFEAFYYVHHIFIAIWILAILHNSTILHQAILAVPFALWGVDRLIRCYRGRVRSHKLVKATPMADALRLEFEGPITSCMPPVATESGSYAFINCPAVSWFQWHPFSISSRAGAPNFTFHIKNMGTGTFTGRLYDHFKSNPNGKIYVDGPYGHCAVRWEEYTSLILIAGGVGVTPMVAILDDIYEKCKSGAKPRRLESVIFCWSVQSPDTLTWMDDVIKKIQGSPEVAGVRFDVQVYVTRKKEESAFYRAGRPSYDKIFDAAKRPPDGAGKEWRTGVLACGPEPMVCDVQTMAQNREVDFHKEVFAF